MHRAAIVTLLVACAPRPVATPEPPEPSVAQVFPPAVGPGVGPGVEPELVAAEPPPRRPLAELATPGQVHWISVVDGVARCDAWDVVPDAADVGAGALVRRWTDGTARTELAYAFESDGERLRIVAASRETHHGDAADTVTGLGLGPCRIDLVARRLADRVEVSGAAWFFDAASCAAALAADDPVATELTGCDPGREDLNVEAEARGWAAFEARLTAGGTLWALDAAGDPVGALRCAQLDVVADDRGDAVATGAFTRALVDDDGNRGEESTGFVYRADHTIDLLGPGETWTSADGTEGWGHGLGCLTTTTVRVLDEDTIEIGAPYHLTQVACERARDAELERRRWLPPTDEPSTAFARGIMPGC